jgi:hypothetical protein
MKQDVIQRRRKIMTIRRLFMTLAILLAVAVASNAQQTDVLFTLQTGPVAASPVGVIEAVPLEPVTSVPNAAFSAEAETEFTQVLGDGNRIERRYSSMVARDNQGRTRRDEEIALVGPLAVDGPSPRLVTILDPVAGQSYTLDDKQRVAYRNPIALAKLRGAMGWTATASDATFSWTAGTAVAKPHVTVAGTAGQRVFVGDGAATKVTTESLGTRSIEGVMAEGTRTTSTIPAGAIGNLMPIEVVSERWYSKELQMPVLISRRDPRSGDSVYRLRNIVKAEPPQDLFTVPPDYEVRGGALGEFNINASEFRILKRADDDKEKVKNR